MEIEAGELCTGKVKQLMAHKMKSVHFMCSFRLVDFYSDRADLPFSSLVQRSNFLRLLLTVAQRKKVIFFRCLSMPAENLKIFPPFSQYFSFWLVFLLSCRCLYVCAHFADTSCLAFRTNTNRLSSSWGEMCVVIWMHVHVLVWSQNERFVCL